MKRQAVVLGWVIASLGISMAAGPRIQFATRVHDFGKVDSGQIAKVSFVFTNVGTSTLEIQNVKPICGCTTAGAWDQKVEPGKTGVIPLQLNTAGFRGAVTKSATVTCNDPAETNIVLQLKASITKPIDVEPPSAYFTLNDENPVAETKIIRIVNHLDQPLTLKEPVWTNTQFRVELATVRPGQEFEVRVTPQPPFKTPFAQATYALTTSSDKNPTLAIPFYANVQPAVAVFPPQVLLPASASKQAYQPTLTVRNSGTNTLVLSEPTINVPGAEVVVKELQPGKVFSVQPKFPAGLVLPTGEKFEIALKSNHPKFPVLKVPVLQSIARQVAPTALPAPSSPKASVPATVKPATGPAAPAPK